MTKIRLRQKVLTFLKDRRQLRAQLKNAARFYWSISSGIFHVSKIWSCSIAEFFDLAAEQPFFWSVRAQIYLCTSQLSVCAANSILITSPKNKEVLNALDRIRRRWQWESGDMNTFFRSKKQLQESMQNNMNKLLLRSILLDWNDVVRD